MFHGFSSSLLSDALRKRYAPPVRTLSMTKGPSHLGLACPSSSLVGVERARQYYKFWPALLCFGIVEPIADRMRNRL